MVSELVNVSCKSQLVLQLPNKVMEVFTWERELHKTVLKTLKQM